MLPPRARRVADLLVELLMAVMALFMVVYGVRLCEATWQNTIAEFPCLVGRHRLFADSDRRR